MSRIDEALRALERAAREERGLPHVVDGRHRVPHRATLDHYPHEIVAVRAEAEPRRREEPRRSEEPEVVNRSRIARHDGNGGADADFSAKLVAGGGVTAVSLEQYRRLAAALHDAQMEHGLKTLMVTSAMPREGKTLTVVNLALTLSESYARRVLLIDADLRWPSVHEVLGLPNVRGLSEALSDDALEMPFVEVSPRLTVLPSGVPGTTPLAGLTSERMGTLLDRFESQFDWVLLDTPPVGLLPDARLLARLIRAVVLVIGAGSTPAPVVERAVAELGAECIVGTVLNRVEEDRIPDASYYSQQPEAAVGGGG